MTTDYDYLTRRLRTLSAKFHMPIGSEAADAISTLRLENAELHARLRGSVNDQLQTAVDHSIKCNSIMCARLCMAHDRLCDSNPQKGETPPG